MPIDVAAPMPQVDLRDQSIVTVTLSDPAAVITSMTLHCWQQLPADPLPAVAPLLAQAPETLDVPAPAVPDDGTTRA